jgi:hypothetical protein
MHLRHGEMSGLHLIRRHGCLPAVSDYWNSFSALSNVAQTPHNRGMPTESHCRMRRPVIDQSCILLGGSDTRSR